MLDDALKPRWFYGLDHKAVVPEEGCRAEVRLGPYPSRDEAARATRTTLASGLPGSFDPATVRPDHS